MMQNDAETRPAMAVFAALTQPQSGYTPCACRDCMDATVSSDMRKPELCSECAQAGCADYVECQREDAYDVNEQEADLA